MAKEPKDKNQSSNPEILRDLINELEARFGEKIEALESRVTAQADAITEPTAALHDYTGRITAQGEKITALEALVPELQAGHAAIADLRGVTTGALHGVHAATHALTLANALVAEALLQVQKSHSEAEELRAQVHGGLHAEGAAAGAIAGEFEVTQRAPQRPAYADRDPLPVLVAGIQRVRAETGHAPDAQLNELLSLPQDAPQEAQAQQQG